MNLISKHGCVRNVALICFLKLNVSLRSYLIGPAEKFSTTVAGVLIHHFPGSWESSRSLGVSRSCGLVVRVTGELLMFLDPNFKISDYWMCSVASTTFWEQECCTFLEFMQLRMGFQGVYDTATPMFPGDGYRHSLLHDESLCNMCLGFWPKHNETIFAPVVPSFLTHFGMLLLLPNLRISPFLLVQGVVYHAGLFKIPAVSWFLPALTHFSSRICFP